MQQESEATEDYPIDEVTQPVGGILRQKRRDWIFVINNYKEEDVEALMAMPTRYIIFSKEVGSKKGTPHIQGFAYFTNQRTGSAFQKLACPRKPQQVSLRWRKGTIKQAAEYCRGDYTNHKGVYKPLNSFVYEVGERPIEQEEKGLKGEEYWKDIVQKVKNRQDELLPESFKTGQYRLYEHLVAKRMKETPYEETPWKMLWLYGQARTGKSYLARVLAESANYTYYLKKCSKWWDGYTGQEVVIIEDMDRTHTHMLHDLKIWADRYPFPAEVKGSQTRIRPKWIIITSNYTIGDVFRSWTPQDLMPLVKRFKEIEISEATDFTTMPKLWEPQIEQDEQDKLRRMKERFALIPRLPPPPPLQPTPNVQPQPQTTPKRTLPVEESSDEEGPEGLTSEEEENDEYDEEEKEEDEEEMDSQEE